MDKKYLSSCIISFCFKVHNYVLFFVVVKMKRETYYDGKRANKPALVLSLYKNPFLDSIPLMVRLTEEALSGSVDSWTTARLLQPRLHLQVSDSLEHLIPLLTSVFRNTVFVVLPAEFSSYLSGHSLSSSRFLYNRSFEDSVLSPFHSIFSSL